MPPEATEAKAECVKVLKDCHVRVELNLGRWVADYTVEQRLKALEAEAAVFEAFVRDHRSQDVHSVDVVREYEEQCSKCEHPWEVMQDEDTKALVCAWCGEEVDV